MDLELVFLGTAGSAPTAARGTSATLVRRGGDRLLFDCGEGTQRQLLRSDTGLVDLEHIFLTHLHADHVLGLPGMLKTFALRGRELPITVYGPRGTRSLLSGLGAVIGRLTFGWPSSSTGRATPSCATGTGSSRSRSPTERAPSATHFARTNVPAGSTSTQRTGLASRTALREAPYSEARR